MHIIRIINFIVVDADCIVHDGLINSVSAECFAHAMVTLTTNFKPIAIITPVIQQVVGL